MERDLTIKARDGNVTVIKVFDDLYNLSVYAMPQIAVPRYEGCPDRRRGPWDVFLTKQDMQYVIDMFKEIIMSDCEKAKIVGYVEQTPEQIKNINDLKTFEAQISQILTHFLDANSPYAVDKRAMSIARTEIQTGFMWAVRAIARPNGD